MTKSSTYGKPEKFGTVIGIAPGNVPVYSSDYDTLDKDELPNRHSMQNYIDGFFMGYKWQCVEFARRWLYLNYGYTFTDIAMAYEIFNLSSVTVIKDNSILPLYSFKNGSLRPPEKGCLLIWDEGEEGEDFEETGHVAIVTEVSGEYIRIAEQNFHHETWGNKDYSRELKVTIDEHGGYWIENKFHSSSLLGWVIQTSDSTHAEEAPQVDKELFNLKLNLINTKKPLKKSWLNVSNPDEAAFVRAIGGHFITDNEDLQRNYFSISETCIKELRRATNELHHLFMYATDYVLENEDLLRKFCFPEILWPRIKTSWDNRKNQMITGRFDFSVSEKGIKVYEYNADSSSCHTECGKIQSLWAKHVEENYGECPGNDLFEQLVEAWQASKISDTLHLMLDEDLEEIYHTLFIKSTAEHAGINCKIIKGTDNLHWGDDGFVYDENNELIKYVWKTWAWETVLDQLRDECSDTKKYTKPRLMDVLLKPEIIVFEPLWTLITSNKAILPILWELFPNNPYLLESSFELTSSLKNKGYAVKPITGRAGLNIQIIDKDKNIIDETKGKFHEKNQIYQEFFSLPNISGYNTQISTFTTEGLYAGACVRVDQTAIIKYESDIIPLRIFPDKDY